MRVADPDWDDPLDGRYAGERGGRWNPPESFPVVYLCRSVPVARANVYRKLEGQPYGPEDLRRGTGPVLVRTTVPEDRRRCRCSTSAVATGSILSFNGWERLA